LWLASLIEHGIVFLTIVGSIVGVVSLELGEVF
jgi:hypothetical protein